MFCEGMEESRPKRWCSVFKMLAWELTCKLWMWKPKETNTVKKKKPRNKKKPHVNWESRWMPYDTLRVLSEFLKSSGACQGPYPGLIAHQLWWWRTRQRVQGSNSRVTIYSLDVLLSQFGTSHCSMSSSNCCFLTCIQISQEAGHTVCTNRLRKHDKV